MWSELPMMVSIEGEPPVSVLPTSTMDGSEQPSYQTGTWLWFIILFASIAVIAVAVLFISAYAPTFLKWLHSPPRSVVAPLPLIELQNVVPEPPPPQV
jgi:hypothetical protein